MFPESEGASTPLSSDFVRALHLLHSSESSSAEELRALLDASIAQRYGAERTILARQLPASFFRCEDDDELESEQSAFDVEAESGEESVAGGIFTDAGGNDVGGKDEVPRISIPDEGQNNDGALCKVCNVPELGPLILIQCRECGELYHPLCHQPPVADARVQDPDFIWRCDDCVRKASFPGNATRDAPLKDSTWIRGDEIKKLSKKLGKQESIFNFGNS